MTLSTDDRIAIAELVARFAHASDYQQWDALAALYVPDVETELEGMGIRYTGIAAQVEHARISAEQTGGRNRHYNFNLFIEEGADGVVATYSFLNVDAGAKALEARIVTSGRMRDRVVKVEGSWRIAKRSVAFDQSFELDF